MGKGRKRPAKAAQSEVSQAVASNGHHKLLSGAPLTTKQAEAKIALRELRSEIKGFTAVALARIEFLEAKLS